MNVDKPLRLHVPGASRETVTTPWRSPVCSWNTRSSNPWYKTLEFELGAQRLTRSSVNCETARTRLAFSSAYEVRTALRGDLISPYSNSGRASTSHPPAIRRQIGRASCRERV